LLRLFYFLELLVLAKLYGVLLFYHAMQSQMVTYFKVVSRTVINTPAIGKSEAK